MELQVLRARATCTRCGSRLPPRTEAWVEADGSGVLCDWCHRTVEPPGPIAVETVRGEALPTPDLPPPPLVAEEPVPPARPRIRRPPGAGTGTTGTGGPQRSDAPPTGPTRSEPAAAARSADATQGGLPARKRRSTNASRSASEAAATAPGSENPSPTAPSAAPGTRDVAPALRRGAAASEPSLPLIEAGAATPASPAVQPGSPPATPSLVEARTSPEVPPAPAGPDPSGSDQRDAPPAPTTPVPAVAPANPSAPPSDSSPPAGLTPATPAAAPATDAPDEPVVAPEPAADDGGAVGPPAAAESTAEPVVGTPATAEPVVGPLVAELPLADGAAPLSWKGELFQGPPVPVAAARPRVDVPPPGADVLAAAVAELAVGRPEPLDRVGAVLRAAEARGLVWLPGRQTPGGFVVDHLAVSPNGIWVVGAEPSPTGRVDKRDLGDWFTPEPRLYVGDDDRTHAVRRLEQVDEALGRVLRDTALASVPRFKVLCFDDTLPGWLDRPFPFDEVWVTWSHHLVEPMLATVDHQPGEVADLARALDQVLVPAT